jgi:hypothetical protein
MSQYAQASWQLPNGNRSSNILLFPFSSNQTGPTLLGAAFPENGMPPPPKNPDTGNDWRKLPAEVIKHLEKVPAPQRAAVLHNFLAKQRQFAEAQSRAVPQPPTPDAGRAAAIISAMQLQQQAGPSAVGVPQQTSNPGTSQMRLGGGVGNVTMLNNDILQNFMQRGGMGS